MKRNKTKDLEKLEQAFWQHLCVTKRGNIGLEEYAQFGGRIIVFDVLKILEIKKQNNGTYSNDVCTYCRRLYDELVPYLKSKYAGIEPKEIEIEVDEAEVEEDLPFQ